MELIDNINKTLKSDWAMELRSGSKVAVAASCFSIYASSFEEDKSRTGHFQICVNDIPLVQWFRQKAHEWRNGLGIN